MEFLDALPEPLLGWHHYDAVIQAVTRRLKRHRNPSAPSSFSPSLFPSVLSLLPLPPPRIHRLFPSFPYLPFFPLKQSDLIEDQEARLRNLRLLLGEIPACHKPLLCKLTATCHRLLQGHVPLFLSPSLLVAHFPSFFPDLSLS
jgi:hypothetical protein